MLSCSCGEWDGDGWTWYDPSDFTTLKFIRRKRCCSCNELIDVDAKCLEFGRVRYAQDAIEEKIYGDDTEIELASWFMCESCGEIYLNLDSLKFCLYIGDDMRKNMKDYQRHYAHPSWQKQL